MRKWLAVVILGLVIFGVIPAHAQPPVAISKLEIDLWPEYDQPDMLVIYHVFLSEDVALPANIALRIPSNAGAPANLAYRSDDKNLYNLTYTQTADGDWESIRFSTPKPEVQLEYYDPQLGKNGSSRNYTFQWPGDYPVDSLTIQVQQPIGASSMQVTPPLGSGVPGSGGMTYFTGDVGPLEAQKTYTVKLSYQKPNDDLSVQSGNVGPSAPINASTPGRATLASVWGWALGAVAVLLIAGGGWWYWRTLQKGAAAPSHRRHAPVREHVTETVSGDDAAYCHQCGKRASAGDIFCRSCGTRLRRDE